MPPTSPLPKPEPTRPQGDGRAPAAPALGARAGPVPAPDGPPLVDALDDGAARAGARAAAPLPQRRRERPPAGRRLARPRDRTNSALTPEQRLLVLDAGRRSGLPAGDLAPLVGIAKHTRYAWKHKVEGWFRSPRSSVGGKPGHSEIDSREARNKESLRPNAQKNKQCRPHHPTALLGTARCRQAPATTTYPSAQWS
jgi:hypothetical protein